MATSDKLRETLTEELKTKPICRFCLTQGPDTLSNIYAKDTPVKSILPLPVEIMSVASIEVFLNDGMPSTVCLKCRLIFDYCYRFKQMCKKAESLLNQVPLIGEWPAPLMKPSIPPEILMKKIITNYLKPNTKVPEMNDNMESPPKSAKMVSSNATVDKTKPSKPKKILNSNPSDLPEPPIPTRTKPNKISTTTNLLKKVENDEEISVDDIQCLLIDQADETEGRQDEQEEDIDRIHTKTSPLTQTTNTTKNKPRVLNKYSIRILNKDAGIDVEPRLKKPRVSHDEDGNVSIVTEILDPNEPYETEPDPVKNTEPVQTNVFPCPYCDRTFPLLQLRDIHMVNHTRERRFQCPDCDRSFFSKYDLQKHSVIHTGERKYKCTVCQRGFTRPALLHRHEKIHTDIPKYICVYCEKQFLSKDDMEKHTERHRKNRPFKCKVCSKSFAFKQGLERHEVVHSSDQPFPCQYCEKSFCTSSKLARHLVAHAGNRPFPCKFCPKSYLLSHHLTRHLRTHKESVVMYSCNECEAAFKTCEELVLHSTVHGTATLTCPLCQQNFRDVESVEAHIKRHAISESYPCEFCDLLFLTSNEQADHVKGAHAQDLAAYNEDENKIKYATDDQDLEEAIEDFLYDDFITPDNQNLHITKQEKFDETEIDGNKQQRAQYMDEEQTYYDETYFKANEEMNNLANTMGAEILTDITIDRQEPFVKKSKLDGETNSKGTIKIESDVQLRRKPIKKNTDSLIIGKTSIRKSPRGGVRPAEKLDTITATTTNRSQMQIKEDSSESSPSSTSHKQTKAVVQQSISQFMVKKEIQNKDYNATTETGLKKGNIKDGLFPDTETGPTGDNVVKMRLGDKQVRVQKIVVTKAEAAAMAKDGRIHIKDGNLVLTKSAK